MPPRTASTAVGFLDRVGSGPPRAGFRGENTSRIGCEGECLNDGVTVRTEFFGVTLPTVQSRQVGVRDGYARDMTFSFGEANGR